MDSSSFIQITRENYLIWNIIRQSDLMLQSKNKITHNFFLGFRIESLQNHFSIFICFSFHNFFKLEKKRDIEKYYKIDANIILSINCTKK